MQDSKNFNLGLSEERLKGVEAFHLKFNKAVAGVGTAYPLCSPGISLHTYNLPEWFYRLGFSQAHRWYNREDREKELGVVLETLPVQRAVSFPSCPPHDVMMTTGLSWICVQSSGAVLTSHALRLRNVLTTSLHLLKLGTSVTSIPKQDREALLYSPRHYLAQHSDDRTD